MADSVLSAKKRRFVELLLSGKTEREAAVCVGVSDRQARRYVADPDVRRYLAHAQDAALHAITACTVGRMGGALATLGEICGDATVSPSARVSAARCVLESAIRFTEVLDLAERVGDLERKVNDGEPE